METEMELKIKRGKDICLIDGFAMNTLYCRQKEKYDNFEVFDTDTFVCSFPKTGTTWTEEMVWLISNNVDFEAAKTELCLRSSFLEFSTTRPPYDPNINYPPYIVDSIKFSNNLKHPRFFKTHLPYDLLPKQIQNGTKTPKIIYVTRNPKDVCTSFYHHARRNVDGFSGSFEEFCERFLNSKALYSPYHKHIRSFVDHKKSLNILFIRYEDMKSDLGIVIKKVANFLNVDLTIHQIEKLKEHLTFENMKNNQFVNKAPMMKKLNIKGEFMRSGKVGSYKEEMGEAIEKKFDGWIKENFSGLEDFVFI